MAGEPSCALRIDGFVRPFTEPSAKAMLAEHGTIANFWMPTIKTHCYVRWGTVGFPHHHVYTQVVYEAVEVAAAAAKAVHNVEWPVGNNSKLRVRYVGAEEAADAIAVGRGEKLPSGALTAPGTSSQARACTPSRGHAAAEESKLAPAKAAVEKQELSLDDLFRKTAAQPAIYWLPLETNGAKA